MRSSEKIIPVIETQHFSEKILNEKSPPLPLITYGKEDYLRIVEIFPLRNWIIPGKMWRLPVTHYKDSTNLKSRNSQVGNSSVTYPDPKVN